MVVGLGVLAVSAVMLIAGAELFTENAAAAARGLRITVFAAAFLLAGAEPAEMITAVIASGRHRPGLAAGGAVGANLTVLTPVLGPAALARPLPVGGRGGPAEEAGWVGGWGRSLRAPPPRSGWRRWSGRWPPAASWHLPSRPPSCRSAC